ncbi:MAG: zinc-ribbon domain-containing protein, partial [Promethearchaeota archaeon]
IIGFFILSTIKKLEGEAPISVPTAQAVPATQPAPAPATSEPAKRFCPNCGSPIVGEEKYCGACGSQL